MKVLMQNNLLELPEDLNARVDKIVKANSFNKRNFLLNAISEWTEDYEDGLEASQILKESDEVYYTLDEVFRKINEERVILEEVLKVDQKDV